MSKVNVKIKREVVIQRLEEALKERQDYPKKIKALKDKYDKEYEKWKKDILAIVKKCQIDDEDNSIFYHSPSYNRQSFYEVRVTYKVPRKLMVEQPKNPDDKGDWQIDQEVKEITENLRLLKLTDDTYINVSSYRAVSQYL